MLAVIVTACRDISARPACAEHGVELRGTTWRREMIGAARKNIHLPGEETDRGFRVFGYAERGQAVDYI